MRFFVQVQNGEIVSGLLSEENLHALAYSPNQLIGHPVFFEVIRASKPMVGRTDYKVVSETPSYVVGNGVVSEVWDVRDMTQDEISAVVEQEHQNAKNLTLHLLRLAEEAKDDPRAVGFIATNIDVYIAKLNDLLKSETLTFADVEARKLCLSKILDGQSPDICGK